MISRVCLLLGLGFASAAHADGDAVRGEELYRSCIACHAVGEGATNRSGPHLNGVFGRQAGGLDGYRYSPAFEESDVVWTAETIDAFLISPYGFIPGTRMAFSGIPVREDRADLIAYLVGASEADGVDGASPEVQAILDLGGDPAYGEYLSSECTACHGNSADAGIPQINGMAPEALVAGLLDYRDGTREHQVMQMLAGRLSDDEIAAIAAYYSTKAPE